MMRVIYKYPLVLTGRTAIQIPVDEDYRIRDVDVQDRFDLHAWIEHTLDPNAPKQTLTFQVVATGETMINMPEDTQFLKTVHFRSDGLVYHIYLLP